MSYYLRSRLVRFGLGMLVVGSGPLFFIGAAVALGLWPDPNPNPVGPGLLFFFTFIPSLVCIALGLVLAWFRRRRAAEQ